MPMHRLSSLSNSRYICSTSWLLDVFFSSRRRHTRYWRDWSSDVCSSDLAILGIEPDHFDCYATFGETRAAFADFARQVAADGTLLVRGDCAASVEAARGASAEVGRASCREREEISADDVILKKKK